MSVITALERERQEGEEGQGSLSSLTTEQVQGHLELQSLVSEQNKYEVWRVVHTLHYQDAAGRVR